MVDENHQANDPTDEEIEAADRAERAAREAEKAAAAKLASKARNKILMKVVLALIAVGAIAGGLWFKQMSDAESARQAKAAQMQEAQLAQKLHERNVEADRAKKDAEAAAAAKAQQEAKEALRTQEKEGLLEQAKHDLESGDNVTVLALEEQMTRTYGEDAQMGALADRAQEQLKENARHGDFDTILNAPDSSQRIKKLKDWAAAAKKAAQPVDYTRGARPAN